MVDGDAAVKSTRFVKTIAAGRTRYETSVKRSRGLVELTGYVTNIPAMTMLAEELLSSYHDLWQVEQPFRMSKTGL